MIWEWCRTANLVLDPAAFLLSCLFFPRVQLRALYLALVLGFVLGHVNGTLNAVLATHTTATWVTGWYSVADASIVVIAAYYALQSKSPLVTRSRRIVESRRHPSATRIGRNRT